MIIGGPPCTAFANWSRFDKQADPEAYAVQRRIVVALANTMAPVCRMQLLNGIHVLVEFAIFCDISSAIVCSLIEMRKKWSNQHPTMQSWVRYPSSR